MLRLLTAIFVLSSASVCWAQSATPNEVRAFVAATIHPNARQDAVATRMNDSVSLETIVREGKIKTVYDCLPEHRIDCFEAIKNAHAKKPTEETIIEEWGDWIDGMDDKAKAEMVGDLMREATRRGFALLTKDELAR